MNSNHRRHFMKTAGAGLMTLAAGRPVRSAGTPSNRPNILFAIADDWSYPHAGAYGDRVVETPAFDRLAREGCLFANAYAAAPQCAPNRASILTGRNIWQNREAGTHASYFPNDLTVFTDLLEAAGYTIGTTGKSWGPGNWRDSGWDRNPAGPGFDAKRLAGAPDGISNRDYAGNFAEFLKQKPKDAPFFFWYGAQEPHRVYKKGIGLESGKNPDDVTVPAFLPDDPEIRSDILDYYYEVEWFDAHLGRMIEMLEEAGELDNTIVVATGDNGMPFPRAKANLYDFGIHMPLAVRWPAGTKGGRKVANVVSSIDFAPTFLEAAGAAVPESITGQSFMGILTSNGGGQIDPARDWVVTGRERHSHARYDNLGYPSRALRKGKYLYIHNLKPDRYPAGDPPHYYDVDGCPSKTFMMEHRDEPGHKRLFDLAFGKRPEEELFDLERDPACMNNLAGESEFANALKSMRETLHDVLRNQGDPRALGYGGIFESYPRFNSMRPHLGGFHKRGEYNTRYRVLPG